MRPDSPLMRPQRLFIIDAMALFFRSFYALGRSSLATRLGVPTGAVYGSALFLNKLLHGERPDYLVAVTDTAAPTFRHDLYPEYKAHRDEMPTDLVAQMPLFFELFEHYKCPMLRVDGFEADDLIGTLVRRFAGPQLHTYIVSGDKDFMQLVGPDVYMYAPKKNEEAQIVDVAAVREKFHCAPEQVIDVLALIGDAVDNVPGVKGIGEKGAAKLIESYGSLDGIYANLAKITGAKQRQGLEEQREAAYLSRQLVTLKTDIPLAVTLRELICHPEGAAANPEILGFFQRLEFTSLAGKVQAALTKAAVGEASKPAAAAAGADLQAANSAGEPTAKKPGEAKKKKAAGATAPDAAGADHVSPSPASGAAAGAVSAVAARRGAAKPKKDAGAKDGEPGKEPGKAEGTGELIAGDALAAAAVPTYPLLDPAAQAELCSVLAAQNSFALIVHASGSDVAADKALALTFGCADSRSFTMGLNEEGIFVARSLLAGPQMKITHGLKLALQMLGNVGIDLALPTVDLELCDYLLEPNNYDHSLSSLALRYLGSELPAAEQSIDASANAVAAEEKKAQVLLQLHSVIAPMIAKRELSRVLWEVEMPLVPVLAAMERKGFYVDAAYLATYSDELAAEAHRLETELYAAAGGPFNINSPKQLQELLFERLKLQEKAKLKRIKRTQTGFSTDESVLSLLAAVHPVPQLILSYRTIMKLKNTYVDTLPQFISPKTNRVHTRFNQAVAATGRLSSDRPNLQNIPIQSPLGRRIRQAFKPEQPGWTLISADYSQVEIRLLAHLANATEIIEAFKNGLDVHTVTAAKIFAVPIAEVTPQLRSRAKAVNFGILYGMGPQRLAAETGTTMTEAKDFIRRYFEVYPGIKAYTEGLIEQAKQTGYCLTMLGRQRPIPELADANQANRARGENIAVNAPIQGSAADLIKLAMIRIAHELGARKLRTQLLLQVHDELVFSAPLAEVTLVMPLIREAMEQALITSVPLKVDMKSGADWLAAH